MILSLLPVCLAALQARPVRAAPQWIPLSVLSFWLNGAQISIWNLSMFRRLFMANSPPVLRSGRVKIRWRAPVRNPSLPEDPIKMRLSNVQT